MSLTTITTVLTAAGSRDLTTLPDVKAELGIADGSSDAMLKRYISSASAAAEQYCNRVFAIESLQDQFLSDDRNYMFSRGVDCLQLARWPVTALTSLVENSLPLTSGTDFLVNKATGQLTRLDPNGLKRHWSQMPITVNYDGGFTTIPVEVADAVIRMVTRRFASKGRDPNLRQQTIPGVIEQSWWIATGSESGNMSPDITDILDNYRVPVVTT